MQPETLTPEDFGLSPQVDTEISVTPENGNQPPQTLWPELSPDALYGLAGDFVKTIEPNTEADNAALLIQFLTAFGNAAGRTAHFIAEADQHFTNMFCCLVGETAKGKKGSSFGHVKRLFKNVDEGWAQDCNHAGLSSGEGLIWCIRDEIKKTEAVKKNGLVTDYQEVIIDPGIPDKRALVCESEFSSVLRVMARDGNTLSAVIRNAWDGDNLKTMTKNSPAKASTPHISIIGHITKDELKRYLDNTECGNGFANRFLWVCVKRSKVLPEGGTVVDLSQLADSVIKSIEFSKNILEIKRDDEAKALWKQVYAELSEGKPGLLGAVTARAEAQVMRLACLYALLDLSDTIRLEHLSAGLALWAYCENSAKYIFGDSSGDPLLDQVKENIDSAPNGLTKTEIYNYFKRHKKAEQLERAFNVLVARGLVFRETEKTPGRNLTRYISARNYTAHKAHKA